MTVCPVEWLSAIDAHPETLDTDLVVAAAITQGSTTVDGWDRQRVDDSIEELIGLGFLDDVFSMSGGCSHPGCVEHVLELRLPEGLRS